MSKGVKLSYDAFDKIEQLGEVGTLEDGEKVTWFDVLAIYMRFLMVGRAEPGNFINPDTKEMIYLEAGEVATPMYKSREFAHLIQDALERIGLIKWRYAPGTGYQVGIIKLLEFETF